MKLKNNVNSLNKSVKVAKIIQNISDEYLSRKDKESLKEDDFHEIINKVLNGYEDEFPSESLSDIKDILYEYLIEAKEGIEYLGNSYTPIVEKSKYPILKSLQKTIFNKEIRQNVRIVAATKTKFNAKILEILNK